MATTNLQQDVLEKIRTGLTTARTSLDVPLLFGHLCKGILEKPGVLRVSAVVGDAAVLDGIAAPCDHDTAFLRHVQRFGREKTLLNWFVCWTRTALASHDRNSTNVSVMASFLVHSNGGALVKVTKEPLLVQVTLSKDLIRALVPEGLAKTYLSSLYDDRFHDSNNEQSDKFCGRSILELELLTAKLQALRMLKKCQDGTKSFAELCHAYHTGANCSATTPLGPSEGKMLQLLSALQIAFAYAEVFCADCLDAGGFVSVSRPHADSFSDASNHLSVVPIFAASTSVTNSGEVSDRQIKLNGAATQEPLSGALHKVSEMQGAASSRGEKICLTTKFTSDSAQQLSSILERHVPNPPFVDWSQNAATWIAHLVSSLREAKHEGGPLEFTFVMGDMAQIEDSSVFERLTLIDAKFDFPPPRTEMNESKMIESLNAAKRAMEKENYFWFQGGRYALLWDFTFPEKQPRYLLGLKDSSWHVFIANARNRQKPATADAALVVGYLDGRGGGGLIVGGEHAFSLSQKGAWIQRGEVLSRQVEDYLLAAGKSILSVDEAATLSKALIAVSNDPNTGCMLVLANSPACPPFETMGQPWKVCAVGKSAPATGEDRLSELSDEKLVALLGMDGAACVWKDGDNCCIAFRKLAHPPGPHEETRPIFSKAKDALSGEGSRKWSAFLAASRMDVNLIVAVSQDGPVHFYAPLKFAKTANNNDITKTSFKDATSDEEVIHDKKS